MLRICINVCVILYHYYQQILCYFSIQFYKAVCMANITNWGWEWYFHKNVCILMLALYKVNWICFLTSQRLKRSWADSTFNIYLCDAALWCLLSYPMLYTHKFIYFPPFFPLFIMWFLLYDYKRMIFHFTNGLSTATST